MIDVDELIRAALRRINKEIDRRAALAHGKPLATANRSVGQLWGRRWIHKRESSK